MFQRIFFIKQSAFATLPCWLFCLVVAVGCGSNSEPSKQSETSATSATDSVAKIQTKTAIPTTEVEPRIGDIAKAKLASSNLKVLDQKGSKTEDVTAEVAESSSRSDRLQSNGETTDEPSEDAGEESSGEPVKKYTDGQLHKNLTTLVLAYQPDVRARHLLKFVRDQLSLEQQDQAVKLILKNDYHFQNLTQKRADILNVALDGDNTEEKLREIKVETLELSNRLRTLVYNEILTLEQQQRRQETLEASRVAKKLELEKKKR